MKVYCAIVLLQNTIGLRHSARLMGDGAFGPGAAFGGLFRNE